MSRQVLIENDLYRLVGELNSGSLLLHLTFTGDKFNKTIYKDMLEDWYEILATLKANGVNEVMSFVDKHNAKICKWQGMFGLSPLLEFEDNMLYRGIL